MGESEDEDFSQRITPVNGAKTDVFWDGEDFPFPVSCSPDMMYQKIESALSERDCTGKLSIWVYVDEKKGSWDEFLGNKTWKARINFLPGGDKLSRRNRMLNDILLWDMDFPLYHPHLVALFVVSDKVKDDTRFFKWLKILSERYYNVFFVTPPQHVRPESSKWPGLLFDDVHCFHSDSESESSEPCPQKHKPDATPEGSGHQG